MSRILPLLLLASCAGPNYLNRDIRRVAVLPPFNETTDLDASKETWPSVEAEVPRRGYELVPREEVEAFYRKNKFALPAEIRMYRWDELGREWNCQGLLYTGITAYGRPLMLDAVVCLRFELIDCKTGDVVWRAESEARASERDDGVLAGILTPLPQLAAEAARRAIRRLPLPGFEPETK